MTTKDYLETLERIKDAEERSNREISERRKALDDDFMRLQEESSRLIAAARMAAEAGIAEAVQKARTAAQAEAERALAVVEKEAESLAAKRLAKDALMKILDEVLFSEFKGS